MNKDTNNLEECTPLKNYSDNIKTNFHNDCYVIRYSEIALKGRNRDYFENLLVKRIKESLNYNNIKFSKIIRIYGKIILYTTFDSSNALKNVLGISSFSKAISTKSDIEIIKSKSLEIFSKIHNVQKKTFKVSTSRFEKAFPLKSPEISKLVGQAIFERFNGIKVDLKNPQITLNLEIGNTQTFYSTEKIKGPNGLPVGCSGNALVLFSGGIDSPVSAYLAMKRGCAVKLIHFYNEESQKMKYPAKIIALHNTLKKFDPRIKLELIPFFDVEREIIQKVPAKYRIIILRRMFLRYIDQFFKLKACIITGDNLAQVASQTLDNLTMVSSITKKLILRPLICYDKDEIVNLSKQIGTFEESIKPYNDCCSLLVSNSPETHAKIEEIEQIEKDFDFQTLKKAKENAQEF
ncbi:MAG TPA: tRNA uracil 4-sulfurtransferase ThiI [Candidatus Woesearchaeota archaeon]|nr:tRNA uracil 4-sulfurtransferase ThiI [Candidatus Woesearchaeota archaeon]